MTATSVNESWWSRPCGGREVLRLALPLVISTGSWSLMNFVDRMFLFWFSTDAMAAAMSAGMLFWTLTCFFIGMSSYVNTFVAQYFGAKHYERIGVVLGQGILFGIFTLPLFVSLIAACPLIFHYAGHPQNLAELETRYLSIMLCGASAAVIASVQSSYFTGRGLTRVVMVVDLVANLLNCGLDYVLIFGALGIPATGVSGAAWATVASQWSKVVMFAWLMWRDEYRQICGLDQWWQINWKMMGRLWWFGAPSGLQLLVEAAAYSILILCIGSLGATEAAATTLALTVNNVAFVPMVGVHIAVSTIVGQQLGNNRPDLAARATWSAMILALAYTLIFAVAYTCFPDWFLMLHAKHADEAEFAAVQPTVLFLLRFVAAYCLFDAMQLVFVGAIKGAGDTLFVLFTTAITGGLMVVAGQLWQHSFFEPLTWWWTVATAWIFLLWVVYGVRFLRGRWREMRVIESSLPVGE